MNVTIYRYDENVLARYSVNAERAHTGAVMRRSQIACGLVIAFVGLDASVPASAQKKIIDCPAETASPPSSRKFSDACFIEPFAGTSLPILLCGDFSSRSLVALAWPAIDGRRGVDGGGFGPENLVNFTPLGTICVEAAWIDMRDVAPPGRLHTRTPGCSIGHPGDAPTAVSEFSLAELSARDDSAVDEAHAA